MARDFYETLSPDLFENSLLGMSGIVPNICGKSIFARTNLAGLLNGGV